MTTPYDKYLQEVLIDEKTLIIETDATSLSMVSPVENFILENAGSVSINETKPK